MILKHSIPIIGVLVVASCAASTSLDQAKLDKWATGCNLPKNSLLYNSDQSVQFNVDRNADFEDVDCLFAKVKKAKVQKFGFVGNEQTRTEEPK